MGFTAILAATAVGGAALSGALNKPPSVNVAPAQSAPKTDPVADAKQAEGAANQERKRAAAAGAQGSTILTGPKGLGEVPDANKGTKNLLGY